MLDEEGRSFYIDFGTAVRLTDVTEEEAVQLKCTDYIGLEYSLEAFDVDTTPISAFVNTACGNI